MNPAAWLAFGIMFVLAVVCVVWACLVVLDLLPENDFFRAGYRDCFCGVIAFFVTGLVCILIGGQPS